MNEYDAALKALLRDLRNSIVETMTGYRVERWLPTEAFKPQNRRMDLLGETATGELLHIELQSTNEASMALRMAEYVLAVYRQTQRFPRQIVLYFGEPKLKMTSRLKAPGFLFRYTVVDIRELDSEELLASPLLADNVIAILGRLQDRRVAVRGVLQRIASAGADERYAALQQLLVLAGLRRMADEIREEAERMPILNDIMDHEVFGPLIRKGRAEGLVEGVREMLRRQIQRRFGSLSPALENQLCSLSQSELDAACLRILTASSVEDVISGPTAQA